MQPVRPPTLWQRLFRRPALRSALIEIENTLAESDARALSASFVWDIFVRYHVPRGVQTDAELRAIFQQAVASAVRDVRIDPEESLQLDALCSAFELSATDRAAVWAVAVAPVFTNALAAHAKTPNGIVRLREASEQLATDLRMAPEFRDQLFAQLAQHMVSRAWDQAIADHRVSPDEDRGIADLLQALGARTEMDAATSTHIARFRRLWQVENGTLPVLSVPLVLQKHEICHTKADVTYCEIRTITRRIDYHGPRARIRIAKGLSYSVGSISPRRVTEEVLTHLDVGTLYVTSKRVLFNGASRNVSIPLVSIVDFTVYADAIGIEKAAGKEKVFLCEGDRELLGAVLNGLLRPGRSSPPATSKPSR